MNIKIKHLSVSETLQSQQRQFDIYNNSSFLTFIVVIIIILLELLARFGSRISHFASSLLSSSHALPYLFYYLFKFSLVLLSYDVEHSHGLEINRQINK